MEVGERNRLIGLDGLRAVAVIGVLLFHADLPWARGGYLGVDLFFVISGFLITGLLVSEYEKTGRVGLLAFYWRRAKRLLPASWLMVGLVVIAAALMATDALPGLRNDALASLGYVTNWELIQSGQSYFETLGRQPLLLHLWSLAIEEQFYLFWAPLAFFLLPRLGRRSLAFVALILAVTGVFLMATHSDINTTRLYFGTDTHGFPLFIGAILGLLWRPNEQRRFGRLFNLAVFALGFIFLTGIVVLMVLVGEETSWLYPWGFLLAAAGSAALIATVTFKGSPLGSLVDNNFMRWIGERSYGIYLWHWPIFMLTRPELDMQLDTTSIFLLRITLTIVIAALSYRFVEMPIRHGALGRLASWSAALVAVPSFSAFTIVVCVLAMSPTHALPPKDVVDAIGPVASIAPVTQIPEPPRVTGPVYTFHGEDLTAIGDSVLLGASPVLKKAMPGARVYAKVSKQAAAVLKEIRELHDEHALTPLILIHLGTNGYVTEKQLRAMLALLSEQRRVIVMNTHVPREWMRPNNNLIDRVVLDYPNVVLADWSHISDHHPEYFVSDGTHLTVRGQKAFVKGIEESGEIH
jgi:peptidoglycan/LPS O-acetylase OafA/YrhL